MSRRTENICSVIITQNKDDVTWWLSRPALNLIGEAECHREADAPHARKHGTQTNHGLTHFLTQERDVHHESRHGSPNLQETFHQAASKQVNSTHTPVQLFKIEPISGASIGKFTQPASIPEKTLETYRRPSLKFIQAA